MATAIEVTNLRKTFGRFRKRVVAVDGLSLTVPEGIVYGFLGPNGAGKTTTIRMLLDLIRPTEGEAYIFGQRIGDGADVLRQRVGSLVEGASFYPFMTGRQNLEVFARTNGLTGAAVDQRIQSLLELVGMADRADRPTKGYSTGMKQRTGIAAALLNDPDLVILDEPTNGLDPRGIQEIRELIRELADERGKTVFLSSHMLHEVEQVCDHVAIINNGKLIRQGKVTDLLAEQVAVYVEAEPLDAALRVLQQHYEATVSDDAILVQATRDDTPAIIAHLSAEDIAIYQITPRQRSLEDYFLEVTHA